jgi:ribosome maturation factor RimP
VAGTYTLEVSSPGADRPLRAPRDFARNVGRDVRVLRTEGAEGQRELLGTVVAATDEGVTLELDDAEVTVTYEQIDHGKVVLPW